MSKEFEDMVDALMKPGADILKEMSPLQAELAHMGALVNTEAGELQDAIKKHTVYQKPLDMDNVIEELGDLEFAMQAIRKRLHITREETLKANVEKLLTGPKARYREGVYTNKDAVDRTDKG